MLTGGRSEDREVVLVPVDVPVAGDGVAVPAAAVATGVIAIGAWVSVSVPRATPDTYADIEHVLQRTPIVQEIGSVFRSR